MGVSLIFFVWMGEVVLSSVFTTRSFAKSYFFTNVGIENTLSMASGNSASLVDFCTLSLTAADGGDFSLLCLKETNDTPVSVKGNEEVIAHKLAELSADGPKRFRKLEVGTLMFLL